MFRARPLCNGDLYETAARLSVELDERLTRATASDALQVQRRQAWDEVAALGWPGLLVSEECSGVGGSLLDLAAIVEGVGRSALALPIVSACGLAPMVLSACPPGARRDAALAGAAEGSARVTPVIANGGAAQATRRGGGWRLSGHASGVEVIPDTTHFVLACPTGESGPGVFLLSVDEPGLSAVARRRMDGRASADLDFTGLELSAADALDIGDVAAGVAHALEAAAALTCVMSVGSMGALLEQTIDFLGQRSQFGVVLASLQALRHQFVELYIAYENARALVEGMLIRWANDEPWLSRDILFMRLRLAEASRAVALGAIQLHGGIGLTEELPAARLSKRLVAAEFDFGGRATVAERLRTSAERLRTLR